MDKDKLDDNNYKKYFYYIKYPVFEEALCKLEIKCLFGETLSEKYLFSDFYICPSRSPFIKEMISVVYEEDSLEQIMKNIIGDKLAYDNFKVCYLRTEYGDIDYEERLKSLSQIGFVITGEPEIHNPKIILGITRINGKWIFGKYEKNDYEWHIHDKKPYSYSNSLSVRVARALVNIAVRNNLELKLIDPCCGVGTVILEALSMEINVVGCELNMSIAENAKKNLKFYGYEDVITNGDMNEIEERYDVAIIDLPYGLFTPTTIEEQTALIRSARKISDRLVLVTFEDMDNYIMDAGFKIVDKSYVCKGKFKRYINVCE
ncbi:TRM11 family SAM-dependent methyltransferase [Clostridium saccharoperbutylacetonicum]|uniref:Putative DNA modification methylase n=1 Tax=Clostridium saccharoperbutylacetonicum N1-4(HMT) TaxID=931276 RepID=M1MNL0_9CLOT|nr:restriction endonuclease subunit M [Clostridium saccharoperbutylacetonicum]AGF59479.1 putative DNA modification methylase [Clostridium saccharoperbutylacetonicum N1-4(HMT)]AQR98167.1 hypothetical protein CLSAP_55220 [Clostridium saccharoperbutylacetonicum]NRT59727.1 tRNA G10 N-methylase Trm11 [Clostridium saccharoperbutylacetonicum]NSB28920.1 tRNA G10 N-methylase Trm11 [Clostridium saccharoperbutylacetonicum]NSB34061.1 tRNA G10 N-methylase Trm11 [Clostridium saccharoperbutylacetonicum]